MVTRAVVILSTLLFSFAILLVSVLRSASINYAFSGQETKEEHLVQNNYNLPDPGKILPDSPLWPIKALRDKLWLTLTTDPGKQVEVRLLIADKRLAMAQALFEKGEPEIGFAVLTKAEKYLEEAALLENKNRQGGLDTSLLLSELASSSMKHRGVQEELLHLAPEDARPAIIAIGAYATSAFSSARDGLLSRGLLVPENPFNRE